MRVWLCCFGVLLALAAPVRADQTDDVDAEMIEAALAENRLTAAYARASAYATRRPDDVRARYLAALAAVATVRYDLAEEHLGAGIQLDPQNADLLGLGARLHLSTGDEARAALFARRALEADPDHVEASDVVAVLATIEQARARRRGGGAGHPLGSPEAFVDDFVARAVAGASADDLVQSIDPRILGRAARSDGAATMLRSAIAGFLDEARGPAARAMHLIGWVVHPAERVDAGRQRVAVELALVTTVTRENLGMVRQFAAAAATRSMIDPYLLATLEGVDARDLPGLIDRLTGTRTFGIVTPIFEVDDGGKDPRIVDVAINDTTVRTILDALGEAPPSSAVVRDRSTAFRIGYALGHIIFTGCVIAAIVWLLWSSSPSGRRRRRRLG